MPKVLFILYLLKLQQPETPSGRKYTSYIKQCLESSTFRPVQAMMNHFRGKIAHIGSDIKLILNILRPGNANILLYVSNISSQYS